jgi:adenine-specific DNA-methyltransferase
MASENLMNEKKRRLLNLLQEMFQLDQPDLDFGLYRIMHAKRAQVEAFLEIEFDQLIDKVFASRGARQEDAAKREYEAARQQAIEFGAPDPEAAPKVQQARSRYDAVRLTGGEDAEIYDHIYRFFSRYYDDGDFMSLRRYGKGAAGGAESYAVPYDGSEVVLHWANKDQYYIKTTENFSNFSFDPSKAQRKDERGISRQLFESVSEEAPHLKVHFRVVEAAEGAHNNAKATEKDERYFLLDDQTPNAWDGHELVIPLNYRHDPERTGQKAKWQEKRNEQLVKKVLDTLKAAADEGHSTAAEYFAALSREVPKGKDKKQSLLSRYVGQYTSCNTMDYFIHKDLGGFLRRELDFYIKNEVLKLDDLFGSEDSDVMAGGVSDDRLKAMQSGLEKSQAIRLLSHRLIDFLAQLEGFQKKLWLKKKFVVEANYCVSLEHVPAKFYPEIAASNRQRDEWVRLFGINNIAADTTTVGYTEPLSVEFLKSNKGLIIDTALFDQSFKERLIDAIEAPSDLQNILLVNSDNFHGLRAVQSVYERSVDFVYIDPPYNTDATEIIYKNGYKHSSWLSLLADRIEEGSKLLKPSGVHCLTIDDYEHLGARSLLDKEFGDAGYLSTVLIRNNPSGRSTVKGFSINHEFALFHAKDFGKVTVGRFLHSEDQRARYDLVDEKGAYEWENFRKSSAGSDRALRAKQHFPIYVNNDSLALRVPELEWDEEAKAYDVKAAPTSVETVVYPLNEAGIEKVWRWGLDRTTSELTSLLAKRVSDRIEIYGKKYLNEEGVLPRTWWDKPEYSARDNGTRDLRDILTEDTSFDFPKAVDAVLDCIQIGCPHPEGTVVDYFGGSGTTAHALIKGNRNGAKRKLVMVEMGAHFDTVLKPRILRASYASTWSSGKPVLRDGYPIFMKYVRLESYEDSLNNLSLNGVGEAVANTPNAEIKRDYMLRYMLNIETQGSQSLLNVANFSNPELYQLEIKKPGSDERAIQNVDLVETFNGLIGLHVDRLHVGQRFASTFIRKADPLLPDDANTRLQVEALTEVKDGAWWFRPVEGYVHTTPGENRSRQSVLVLWRTLTSDAEQDAAVLDAFLAQQMKFNPNRRADKSLYDVIYINGTHNLPNLGKYGEVRLLEEEFHRRMWAGE